LYENTIDAINEWLLYRPMIKDEGWDVFFTGKLTTSSRGDSEWTKSYEMTHLTCFIGGMYGLGGKIFGRDGDIDKAKKLTDGCVWAYQSTATGLMPEYAHLVACPALEKCPFSEESWYEDLDPNSEWRDSEFSKWSEGEALRKLAGGGAAAPAPDSQPPVAQAGAGNDPPAQADKLADVNSDSELAAKLVEAPAAQEPPKVVKRAGIPMPKLDKSMEEDNSEFGSTLPDSLKQKIGLNKAAEEKADTSKTDTEKVNPVQDTAQKTSETKPAIPDSFDARIHGAQVLSLNDVPPERPQTHEEYVKSRIEKERLPPGYTDIMNRNYLLR
jgi:mannosyl-oligosaccharide alpha-1,2-mannosidase